MEETLAYSGAMMYDVVGGYNNSSDVFGSLFCFVFAFWK